MFKKTIWIGIICLFLIGETSAFLYAQENNGLAYQAKIVTRQTPFNDLTDSIATTGKTPMEKAQIINDRKEARRLERLRQLQKEREKKLERQKRAMGY